MMWTTKDIPDQSGKTVIVTGANTGIGYETALALFMAGAHVTIACRDLNRAGEAIKKMSKESGKGQLKALMLDLSDPDSIKSFSEEFLQNHSQLNVLINNAGVSMPPKSKTKQGFELQFGVNFLGHFALTGLLYPLLKSTLNSRIITVSSNGYQSAEIDFENLKSKISYDPLREYRQSKLADLMFAIELHRRLEIIGDKVFSIAVQPGANKTELTRYLSKEAIQAGVDRLGEFMEPWQGALPTLFAAVSNQAVGGNLYEPHENGYRGYPVLASIKENALDRLQAQRLWSFAEKATGIYFPLDVK